MALLREVRPTILLWMLLPSVAASIFLELSGEVQRRFDFAIAAIVGRALSLYVMSGALPFILWMVKRKEDVPGEPKPLRVLWFLLLCALAFLQHVDITYQATHHPHV
jgi:hypothetical protein